MKERKLRIEDALAATRAAAEEGIVPGGGIALLSVQQNVAALLPKYSGDAKTGVQIILRALEEPIRQIAANAVLLKPLDNDTTAVGIPAQPIKVAGVPIENRKRAVTVEHFEKMEQRVKELEAELERLRAELAENSGEN